MKKNKEKRIIRKDKNKKYIFLWIIIFLSGIILFFYKIVFQSIWYDESYSIMIIRHLITDIIKIISKDNHPPLYFILLKLYRIIAGDSIFALRAFSVFGAIALISLGPWLIRRIFDIKTALFFSCLVIINPVIISLAKEIRMYTWSCFFVTATALYGYLIIIEDKIKNYILFGIFCLASAYIHYYAFFSILYINFFIFIWILIYKKEKLIPFAITGFSIFIFYFPWLFVFFNQGRNVINDYWIPELSLKLLWNIYNYPFLNKHGTLPTFFSFLGSSLFYFCTAYAFKKNNLKEKQERIMIYLSLFIITGVIITGVIISHLIKPILVARYIFVVYGLLLIIVSFSLNKINKKLFMIVVFGIIFLCAFSQISFILNEDINGPIIKAVDYLKGKTNDDDVFLHSAENTFGVFAYYLNKHKHYLFLDEKNRGYSNFETFYPIGETCFNISDFLKNKNRVWIIEFQEKKNIIPMDVFSKTGKYKIMAGPKTFRNKYSFNHIKLTLYYHKDN